MKKLRDKLISKSHVKLIWPCDKDFVYVRRYGMFFATMDKDLDDLNIGFEINDRLEECINNYKETK